MCLYTYESEPEPEERLPAGPPYVPVRPGPGADTDIPLFRTSSGTPTAVGLTSEARPAAAPGSGQASLRMPYAPQVAAPVRTV